MDAWYHLFITIYDKFSKHNENAKCDCWWYDVPSSFFMLFVFLIHYHCFVFVFANTLAKPSAVSQFCSLIHISCSNTIVFSFSSFRFIFAWKLLMIKISSIFSRTEFVCKRARGSWKCASSIFPWFPHLSLLQWFHHTQHLENVEHDMRLYFIFAQIKRNQHYNRIRFCLFYYTRQIIIMAYTKNKVKTVE